MNQAQPAPILVVEDSDEDYAALVRVLQPFRLLHLLIRCQNGDEALDYLLHRGRYSASLVRTPPAIILLDLNLPGTDGREVLEQVKGDANLRMIPVVILTTSSNPSDIRDCYDRGANAYQVKAANYEGFKTDIQRTVDYWLGTTALPVYAEKFL